MLTEEARASGADGAPISAASAASQPALTLNTIYENFSRAVSAYTEEYTDDESIQPADRAAYEKLKRSCDKISAQYGLFCDAAFGVVYLTTIEGTFDLLATDSYRANFIAGPLSRGLVRIYIGFLESFRRLDTSAGSVNHAAVGVMRAQLHIAGERDGVCPCYIERQCRRAKDLDSILKNPVPAPSADARSMRP